MPDNQSELNQPANAKPKDHGNPKATVQSNTPENVEGQLNPAAPGNTGTTPGTNAKLG